MVHRLRNLGPLAVVRVFEMATINCDIGESFGL